MFSGIRTSKLVLTEEKDAAGKPTGNVFARGEFGKADEPTGNNRIYPRRIVEREVAALQKQIQEKGGIIGELDHPADGKTQLKRVSHVITKLELQPDGTVIGESKILDTEYGKTLKEIVKSGVGVGVSSRGTGSVMINEAGQEVVQDDYHMVTYDFVAEPAASSAYPTFVMEEKNRREATMAEETKPALTLEDLKAKHQDLIALVRKESEEQFAKRVGEIRQEERNLAKDELREQFKKEMVVLISEQRTEVEKQIRKEVLDDPKVAKAQKVLETMKNYLRPLITDEDVSTVVKEKDEEISKLKAALAEERKKIEDAQAETAGLRDQLNQSQATADQVGEVAREMGYKLFLERATAGLTTEEKDLVKSFIGDLKAIKSKEELQSRTESAKDRAKKLLAEHGIDKKKVTKTVEEIEKEVSKVEKENGDLKAEVTKLTEGLERSLGVAKELGLKAYIEKKISDHPRRPEIRKVIDSKSITSKEEADKVIATLSEDRKPSDTLRQIRESVKRGQGRTVEEETTPRKESREVMGVPVDEMRRLSGLDK